MFTQILEHRYIRGDKMAIPLPLPRQESTSEFHPLGDKEEVEYFFASDASAIIEHTNQVIYLEVCARILRTNVILIIGVIVGGGGRYYLPLGMSRYDKSKNL